MSAQHMRRCSRCRTASLGFDGIETTIFTNVSASSSTIRRYACDRCGLRATLRDFPIGWTLVTALGVLVGYNVVRGDGHPRSPLDPVPSMLPLVIAAIAAGLVWLWKRHVLEPRPVSEGSLVSSSTASPFSARRAHVGLYPGLRVALIAGVSVVWSGCAASNVDRFRAQIDSCLPSLCSALYEVGVARDLSDGERDELYEHACSHGVAEGCFKQASRSVERGSSGDAWLERGCALEPDSCLYLGRLGLPGLVDFWHQEPTVERRLARIRWAAASKQPRSAIPFEYLAFRTLEPGSPTLSAGDRSTNELLDESKRLCEAGEPNYCYFNAQLRDPASTFDHCEANGSTCWMAGFILRRSVDSEGGDAKAAGRHIAAACAKDAAGGCVAILSGWKPSRDSKPLPASVMKDVCMVERLTEDPFCEDSVELTPERALKRCLANRNDVCTRQQALIRKVLKGEWAPSCDRGPSDECRTALGAIASELAWRAANGSKATCKLGDPACIVKTAEAFGRGERAWLEMYTQSLPDGSVVITGPLPKPEVESGRLHFVVPAEIVLVTPRACDVLPSSWRASCDAFRRGIRLRAPKLYESLPACVLAAVPSTASGPVRETVSEGSQRRDVAQFSSPVTDYTGRIYTEKETVTTDVVHCTVRGAPGDEDRFLSACNACFRDRRLGDSGFCAEKSNQFRSTCTKTGETSQSQAR